MQCRLDLSKRYIAIRKINLSDQSLCFRFFPEPPASLIDSVKRYGILMPPLIYPQEDSYQLLDGFRRIDAALTCGDIEKIFCFVCNNNLDLKEKIFLAISIFLSSHTPDILDKATLLLRVQPMLDEKSIIQKVLPVLGMASSKKVLERLVPLAKIDKELGKGILSGDINEELALRLMSLPSGDRKMLYALFEYYNYSQSKQFELFENLTDITMREGKSIKLILEELGWANGTGIESKKDITINGESFRKKIKARHSPVLTRLELDWIDKTKRLRIPPAISLNPPPYFEGNKYRISFSFEDEIIFRERVDELKKISDRDEWKKLFHRDV